MIVQHFLLYFQICYILNLTILKKFYQDLEFDLIWILLFVLKIYLIYIIYLIFKAYKHLMNFYYFKKSYAVNFKNNYFNKSCVFNLNLQFKKCFLDRFDVKFDLFMMKNYDQFSSSVYLILFDWVVFNYYLNILIIL